MFNLLWGKTSNIDTHVFVGSEVVCHTCVRRLKQVEEVVFISILFRTAQTTGNLAKQQYFSTVTYMYEYIYIHTKTHLVRNFGFCTELHIYIDIIRQISLTRYYDVTFIFDFIKFNGYFV